MCVYVGGWVCRYIISISRKINRYIDMWIVRD